MIAATAGIVKAKADLSRHALVVGHTDAKGSASYNKRLSAQRAESAAVVLRRLVPGARFTTRGRGAEDPVAANTMAGNDFPQGRALNRRVEIAYTPKPVVTPPAPGAAKDVPVTD